MQVNKLPAQPPLWFSYYRVTSPLLAALILFVLESIWYGYELWYALDHRGWLITFFWLWCFLFSFVHIFLVIMDGWSRFQNYKRIKDQFYRFGFQSRIAEAYIVSSCQRRAVKVAAQELGLGQQVVDYYRSRDVKWYHFVPYFMLQDPWFFFKKAFWSRTFIEKHYTSKIDYHALSLQLGS